MQVLERKIIIYQLMTWQTKRSKVYAKEKEKKTETETMTDRSNLRETEREYMYASVREKNHYILINDPADTQIHRRCKRERDIERERDRERYRKRVYVCKLERKTIMY